MKKEKNKRVVAILLIILLIVICIVVWIKSNDSTKNEQNISNISNEEFVKIENDGTKVNTSNKLKNDKKIDDLILTNIKIETKNNETIFEAIVKNTTNETKGDYPIKLKIKDKEGNIIKEVSGYISSIEANDQSTLKIKTSYDFANAYDFEIAKD